jgi:hypothetical protein
VRVCKCPQPPLLAHASGAALPHLLSAQGTQVDLWCLGVAHNRQQHVRLIISTLPLLPQFVLTGLLCSSSHLQTFLAYGLVPCPCRNPYRHLPGDCIASVDFIAAQPF